MPTTSMTPRSTLNGNPAAWQRLSRLGIGESDARDRADAVSQEDFASILNRGTNGKPTPREAAESFVSVALVQPILKSLREGSIGADLPPPFGPGNGEKQFRTLADTHVARQIVRAGNWPVVDRIARDLGKAALRAAGKPVEPEVQPGSPAEKARRNGYHHAPRGDSATNPQ